MEKHRPLKRIAADLGIAEIRIWQLIRNGHIESRALTEAGIRDIYVDENEVREYFDQNPELLDQLQKRYQSTQNSISNIKSEKVV